MALNYKQLKKKLDETPLSLEELKMIDNVETYIDKEILTQFDKSIYGEISIDYCYPSFRYSPVTKSFISNLGVSRIPKMKAELERRFISAGWKIEYRLDDGSDRNGADYMILKGAK